LEIASAAMWLDRCPRPIIVQLAVVHTRSR